MMRVLLLALVLPLVGCDNAIPTQAEKLDSVHATELRDPVHPFPDAVEVRLFTEAFGPNGTSVTSKGKRLSGEQRAAFERLLYVKSVGDDYAVAACFIPHHFFRYYDARGKQIGEVAVCFCCSGVDMTPNTLHLKDSQVFEADYGGLKKLVASWGVSPTVDCARDES